MKYFIKKVGRKNVFIVRGNHDTILKPIVTRLNITLKDTFIIKKKDKQLLFTHGDVIRNKKANYSSDSFEKGDIIFLGHLHPAITLSDEYKREKFKCFLHGTWNRKNAYILPSFGLFSFGYDLLDRKYVKERFFIIPFSVLKNFEVIIYNSEEKKEYNFGMLKQLL